MLGSAAIMRSSSQMRFASGTRFGPYEILNLVGAGGMREVFTEQRQVSTNGGMEPIWRPDGRELFYLDLDGRLMAVPISTGPTFDHGRGRRIVPDGNASKSPEPVRGRPGRADVSRARTGSVGRREPHVRARLAGAHAVAMNAWPVVVSKP